MRAVVLALVLSTGCWHHAAPLEGSAASRGNGGELTLPPDLGSAERLRLLVEREPVIGRIDRGPTPVVIRGRVPRDEVAELVALARLVHDDVSARLVSPRSKRQPPIDLVLYRDDEEYQALALGYAHVPAGGGFYRPDARAALVNLTRGRGNLRHELVHPLLADDFPEIPPWLNEGIAAMYGAARVRHGGLSFVTDYRLYDLLDAMEAGALPSRSELAFAGRDEMYGEGGATYYATAQHVAMYLQHSGQLGDFYRRVRARPSRRGIELATRIDWNRFTIWVRQLRIGVPPSPP